jgi:hypothetical protein
MKKTLTMLLILTGCAGSTALAQRGKAETGAAALEACRDILCPPRVERAMQDRCMADRGEQYGALADAKARRAFLVQGGCPEKTIDGAVEPKP